MVWFIVGMLVLLGGGAAVLFVVFHATDDFTEPVPFSPDSDDPTPVGDTSQHSGEQTSEGETVGGTA